MMFDLVGKVAVVTGSGSGIGRATARLFARQGAKVVLAEINETDGESAAAQIIEAGGDATFIRTDVTDAKSVEAMVAETEKQYGGVHILHNNAVEVTFVNEQDRRVTELPQEVWQRMLDVVLTGTFLCCKYVGRAMMRCGQGPGGASIVNTATVDALLGVAGLDAYTAAKGGVVAMTRSMAAGLARDNIRVNALCPGFVTTPHQTVLTETVGHRQIESLHLMGVLDADDVANFALYLASDEARKVTGGVFPIDSGYSAFKTDMDVMGSIGGHSAPVH